MVKMLKILGVGLVLSTIFAGSLFAGWVNGYYKSNGTYVSGYNRSEPNSSPYDNYSRPGNYNPNKGIITPGNQNTYDNNYYNKNNNSTFNNNNSIFNKNNSMFGN